MIVISRLHPHIWNKLLMYLRRWNKNAFPTGLLYFIHSWTTSRHRAKKWNKTHIWTIPKNETNHLFYCFLENETKRICIQLSWNHLPYPLLFSRKWNKTFSPSSRQKTNEHTPILKNQTKHLGFEITEKWNETYFTMTFEYLFVSTPLKRLYIFTP